MFEVITDVERYPEFVPYCVGASQTGCSTAGVVSPSQSEVLASLDLAANGIREQFTTRNVMIANERIEMHLVSGPFSAFTGVWALTAIGASGCRTDLSLQFEFGRGLRVLSHLVGRSLARSADRVLAAFCQRAEAQAKHG